MSLICPKCRGAFENMVKCPKCGVVLADLGGQQKSNDALSGFAQSDGFRWGKPTPGGRRMDEPAPLPPNKWYQSPAGRMVAGLVVALGLVYGLLQLAVTVLRVMGKTQLTPEVGLGIFYGCQAFSLLVAGFLIGVGRRKGGAVGIMVGIVSGIVLVGGFKSGLLAYLLEPFSSNLLNLGNPANPVILGGQIPVHQISLFGLPIVHSLCAGFGGLMGRVLFRPAPELLNPSAPRLISAGGSEPSVGLKTHVVLPSKSKEAASMLSGSIAWIRCFFASVFAIAGGSFGTKTIRDNVLEFLGELFKITNAEQDYVTLLEFFALSIFLGGAIAGATKPNGLKQGIVVGVASGIGMVPFLASGEQAKYIPAIVISALFLAPLGGWFGTSLIPPPPPPRLHRSYD